MRDRIVVVPEPGRVAIEEREPDPLPEGAFRL
jgi:hypothetical protein